MKALDLAYVIVGIVMRALWYGELALFAMALSWLTQTVVVALRLQ